MPGVIVLGAQWGDEGKGKIVDILTSQAQHVVRAQGGNNAGHTILIGKEEYKLNLIPSGIFHNTTQCYIGAGTVIDPAVIIEEIKSLESRGHPTKGRLWISPAAHIILPYHRLLDLHMEKRKKERSIGTTGRGIGPCYADKANRLGIRMGELIRPEIFSSLLKNALSFKNEELKKIYDVEPLLFETVYTPYTKFGDFLKSYVTDVEITIFDALKNDENVLFEGAQGTFLDITLGTYPFVTSSNTTAGGICSGSGIGPSHITHTLGVVKAYTTRVGNGPLPTEDRENEIIRDHQQAREMGTTTGRKRRIGWFDAVLVKTAIRFNGLQSIALTKLDILDTLEKIKIATSYKIEGKIIHHVPALAEDLAKIEPIYEILPGWNCSTQHISTYEELPIQAKNYLKKIEAICQIPISMISFGPERNNTLMLRNPFDT